MRAAALTALLLAFSAGAARAADVTMVVRDVTVPVPASARSLATATPRFNLVGVHWQGSGTPWFRVRLVSGGWSAWQAADDDWGYIAPWHRSLGAWVGAADRIEFRLRGRVTRLREYLLWSPPVQVPSRRLQLAGSPQIIPRSGWQADESIRRAPPVYAPTLQVAVVHHTDTPNSYSCSQSAAIVRGIEVYHVRGNGWNDIGYNFLVDKCGQIFEGRYGGIDKNVVGAHALGFNYGTVGVSMIGTYDAVPISAAARQALVSLLSWRLDVAHVDPLSFTNYISGGSQRFPAGIPVSLRAISGHRDTNFTDCPGNALYAQLPSIAQAVAQTGLPKIYAPAASVGPESQVLFTARLSSAQPWTVTVTDQSGAQVASGSGTGTAVDWTWDASSFPSGRYDWTIASANARSATGTLGAKTTALALQKAIASPQVVSPNGDGVDDTTTIAYTLTQPAQVTATLVNAVGATVFTFFSAQQQGSGAKSFVFAPDPSLLDGPYTVALSATGASGQTVTGQVPVTLDRVLSSFAVSPQLFTLAKPPLAVTFNLGSPEHVTLNILDAAGHFVAQAFDGDLQAGAQTLTWDGSKRIGKLVDGDYLAAVVLREPTGAVTHALPFVADSTPPRLKLLSVTRHVLRFRLAEDATVVLTAAGRSYSRQASAGIVRFWLPAVLPFAATATDAAGNVSATIRR